MNAGRVTDSAERLNALGYRRISRKYGIVARIDRPDWLQVMATSLLRVPADFIDPKSGAPTESWCDHYRRVYSKDSLTLGRSDPRLLAIHESHDAVGYIDPETMRVVEPAKLPADVLAFLDEASQLLAYSENDCEVASGHRQDAKTLWEKYRAGPSTTNNAVPPEPQDDRMPQLLKAAREWRSFQEEDSVADQRTDPDLRFEANCAAGRLLAAVDALDKP